MSVPVLSELREPPIVGKFYMVPVVRHYPYYGHIADWPVIGPLHSDEEFFNFPAAHYHVDIRFVSRAQMDWFATTGGLPSLANAVGTSPLYYRGAPLTRPEMRRRKCQSVEACHAYQDKPAVRLFREHYGTAAAAIFTKDGRALCPHRKADLTQFPADDEGNVMCPLHGLTVCVRRPS